MSKSWEDLKIEKDAIEKQMKKIRVQAKKKAIKDIIKLIKEFDISVDEISVILKK